MRNVIDSRILTTREVDAMRSLLGITLDRKLKRLLEKRLHDHDIAVEIRDMRRAIYQRKRELRDEHISEILNRS